MFNKHNFGWLFFKTATHPNFHLLNIFLCLFCGFSTIAFNPQTIDFMQIWTGVAVLTSTIAILFASTSLFLSSLTILYWLLFCSFLILDLHNNSYAFYVYLPSAMSLIAFFNTENKLTLALGRFFLLGLIGQLLFAFQQNYIPFLIDEIYYFPTLLAIYSKLILNPKVLLHHLLFCLTSGV